MDKISPLLISYLLQFACNSSGDTPTVPLPLLLL
jgi:hypothetical protein